MENTITSTTVTSTSTSTNYTVSSIRRHSIAVLYNAVVNFALHAATLDDVQKACDDYAAAMGIESIDAAVMVAAAVSVTIKGNPTDGYKAMWKVKGMGTMKKLFSTNISHVADVKPAIVPELVEKGGKKTPAVSKPLTDADKVLKARYNLEKAEYNALYNATHKADGTRYDNGAIEKKEFPTFAEWMEKKAA